MRSYLLRATALAAVLAFACVGSPALAEEKSTGDTTAAVTYLPVVTVDPATGLYAAGGGGGGGGGTEYTEDAPSAANPVGGQLICRRRDTLSASEVSADLDNVALNCTAKGQAHTFAELAPSEVHAAEVGSNQIPVQVAQTVTASSAYATGNAIGGLITIAGATRVSGTLGAPGTGGLLQSVVANLKSLQTGQIDVFIFTSNPTGSTCTDKTAFSLAAADAAKSAGVVSVSSWFAGGVGSIGQAQNLALPYGLSSSTTLYACAVARSTPTFGSTSDVTLTFNLLR